MNIYQRLQTMMTMKVFRNRVARSIWILSIILAVCLAYAQQPQKPRPLPTPSEMDFLLPPGTRPAVTPTPAPREEQAGVNLDLATTAPAELLQGLVKTYVINDESQFMAGQLAEAFIGDYVLENDLVRAVISKPNPSKSSIPGGGNLIDLAYAPYPIDYINFIETQADLESTRTRIIYAEADEPAVIGGTTAVVVMKGFIGERWDDDPATAPCHRIKNLDVTTTYALAKNDNILAITTRITNGAAKPVSLLPGDLIDWGLCYSFFEGSGLTGSLQDKPYNWVLSASDEFSAGYVISGQQPLSGISSGRYAAVRGYGSGAFQSPYFVRNEDAASAIQAGLEPSVESSRRATGEKQRAVRLPEQIVETPPQPSVKTPKPPPGYRYEIRGGVMAPVPISETEFTPRLPKPLPQPQIAPPETNDKPTLPAPQPNETGSNEGAPGGGGESNDKADSSASASVSTSSATKPAAYGNVLVTSEPATERLTLLPGESYEFTRYIPVSNSDFSQISGSAYRLKNIPAGVIAGVVMEEGSDKPVAGAEIRISGGPDWNGQGSTRAFTKAVTRADGTFVVRVPKGTYVAGAFRPGSVPVGRPQAVQVIPGAAPQLLPLQISRLSILRLAVVDPDTPTTTPLPCKATFLAKPGTQPANWGAGPGVSTGVRNVYYLPYGAAEIPLSPGRYQMTISRGIEYDIIQRDITIEPTSAQKMVEKLPRAIKTPGMISVDAGVMTTASAVSKTSPRDRIIMAACEGVPLLVTGDYNTATNLQPEVQALGLGHRVRVFMGMRFLVKKGDLTADLFVYPLNDEQAARLQKFRKQSEGAPPDIFIADLRKEFPELVIEVDRPMDPQVGYFHHLPFNAVKGVFDTDNIPPADFNAIQITDGKIYVDEGLNWPRYSDLLNRRTREEAGAAPLAPTGGSNARLPFAEEVGYPRMYIYTSHDTLDRVTAEDIARAVRGQHIMVTNGPVLMLSVWDPATNAVNRIPGDVVDYATTNILDLKVNVLAAPWIDLSGININMNGLSFRKIGDLRPINNVLRYPVRAGERADRIRQILTGDCVIDAAAYSNRRSLGPVVASNPQELGGEIMPFAWTGPIFIDTEGNGKVVVKPR